MQSDIELAVQVSSVIEQLLESRLDASGRGLHEKLSSVEHEVDVVTTRKIRRVATLRNKVIHERYQLSSEERQFLSETQSAIVQKFVVAKGSTGQLATGQPDLSNQLEHKSKTNEVPSPPTEVDAWEVFRKELVELFFTLSFLIWGFGVLIFILSNWVVLDALTKSVSSTLAATGTIAYLIVGGYLCYKYFLIPLICGYILVIAMVISFIYKAFFG